MSKRPFDLDVLKEMVGPKVFARGEGYAEAGYVELVDTDEDAILAHVHGSETYVVDMTPSMNAGLCTCPAFEDWGFCKHLVAVAMVYNDSTENELKGVRGRMSRLREGLALEDREALIARLVDLARRYPEVLTDIEDAD
jgi:uncharacterized Zn finger protein